MQKAPRQAHKLGNERKAAYNSLKSKPGHVIWRRVMSRLQRVFNSSDLLQGCHARCTSVQVTTTGKRLLGGGKVQPDCMFHCALLVHSTVDEALVPNGWRKDGALRLRCRGLVCLACFFSVTSPAGCALFWAASSVLKAAVRRVHGRAACVVPLPAPEVDNASGS
eukprot:3998027-Amphidinium_carterae.1